MIYVQNQAITAEEFEQLLSKTKSYCLKRISEQSLKGMQGVPFEKWFFNKCQPPPLALSLKMK